MRFNIYTILGFIAILFWSTTIGLSRFLIERLGTITTIASIFLLSGIIGTAATYGRKNKEKLLGALNPKYLFICGFLFVLYMFLLYSSIGLVSSRQQVIEIGLLNYLWPSLTILFSIYIFNYKFQFTLLPGLILATLGIYFASIQNNPFSFSQTMNNISYNLYPYLLAIGAAVSWGLYSNLSKLWGRNSNVSGMPLFILVTGMIFLLVRLFVTETSSWDFGTIFGVVFMAVFPTFLGYQFWDKAMQKGDIILVASFSYFTPVLATIFSCMFLDLNCGWVLWLACGLVLAGSVVSKLSVKNNQQNLT